jgi:hypothetical protein
MSTTDEALTAIPWATFVASATLLEEGTYAFGSTGWHGFTLDTPYIYTGGNLLIGVEANVGGGGAGPIPYFYYTAGAANSHEYWYADNTPPTGNGNLNSSLPNVMLHFSALGEDPELAINPTSWNFGTRIINTVATKQFALTNIGGGTLGITSITISGDFYSLTVNPAPVDLGGAQTTYFTVQYAPTAEGTHIGTVYVTDNLGRTITEIPLTASCTDPSIYDGDLPYTETFEAWPPIGWDLTGGTYSFTQFLSGTNNWARANFWSQSAGNTDIMTTPPINITNPVRLNFLWSHQYSASYPADALTVQISTNYTDWTNLLYLTGPTDFDSADGAAYMTPGTGVARQMTIPVEYVGAPFWIRFFGYSGYGPDLFIDNVNLEFVPETPVFVYSPATLNFEAPAGGFSGWQNVTVTNNGAGSLVLNPTDIQFFGTDSVMFEYSSANLPAALGAGQSVQIPIRFAPTSEGAKTATFRMTYDGVNYDVALNGTATPAGLITVGTGTTAIAYPYATYWHDGRTQILITAAELSALGVGAGLVAQIGFNVQAVNSSAQVLNEFWIRMKHTTATAMTAFDDAGLVLCYDENIDSPPLGWNMYTLESPFGWNGVDNLLIDVSYNNTSYTQYSYVYGSNAPGMTWFQYTDGADGHTLSGGGVSATRPNTRMLFMPEVEEPPAVPVLTNPADLAVNLPKAGFNLTWTMGTGGGFPVDYVVYLSDDPLDVMGQSQWITSGTGYNPVTQGGYTFDYEGVYYWTVVARNTYGNSAAATTRQFTIESEAIYPYLLLDGDVLDDDITLNWQLSVVDGSGEWIGWDSGINDDAIGTGGAVVFSVAAKFTTADLVPYVGQELAALKFFPYKNFTGQPTQASTYTIKVWTGTDGDLAPVTEVASQLVNHTFNEWNEVLLTTPVPITGTTALYIGYEVDTTTGYPAGCDAGPAFDGFGNLMYFEGEWTTLLALAPTLDYNWNIEGYVQPAGPIRGELLNIPVVSEPNQLLLASRRLTTDPDFAQQPTRVLQGYNVYRDNVLITPTPITANTYLDSDLLNGTYTYRVEALYETATIVSNNWIGIVNVVQDRPDAPILAAPADLATNLPIGGIQFSWARGIGGGVPSGYMFSMADDPERLFSEEDSYMADVAGTTHTPAYAYEYSTTYYWAVYAYNAFGESEISDIFSFTTRDVPSGITTFPWVEDFETVTVPALPEGWTVIEDSTPAPYTWVSTTAQNHTTGGGKSVYHRYHSTNDENGFLVTPAVTVPVGLNMVMSWWNYNAFPTWYVYNGLLVSTSPTGPWTQLWTTAAVTSTWVQSSVNISAYGGQTVYFAFNYQGLDAHDWYVDDVSIFELSVDNMPPVITHLPVLNTPREDVSYLVYADIVDDATWNNPIGGANVYYSVNGGAFTSIPMILDRDGYYAFIPAQALDSQVDYYIQAWDILNNTTITNTFTFYVEDPTWVWYDLGGTGWTWFGAGQAFSPMNVFENPFYGTGNAVQVNAVDGAAYDVAATTQVLATLHVYSWDGVSDLELANFVDLTGPVPVTFQHLVYRTVDLTAYNIQVTDPYFIVLYELPVSAAFLFDNTYDYGMTFAVINGLIYSLSNPGMWAIGANVGTGMSMALDTPVVTISQTAGAVELSWDAITGASSYLVLASDDAYAADPWTLLTSTNLLAYTYTGTEAYKFFKVVASSEAPIIRATLNTAQRIALPTLSASAVRSPKTIKEPVTGLRK